MTVAAVLVAFTIALVVVVATAFFCACFLGGVAGGAFGALAVFLTGELAGGHALAGLVVTVELSAVFVGASGGAVIAGDTFARSKFFADAASAVSLVAKCTL